MATQSKSNTHSYQKILLMVVTGMFWFAQYGYVPYVNPYLNSIGLAASTIGVISGSFGFTQFVCRLPFGFLADRLNRQKLFVSAGSLCTAIAGLGFYVFPTGAGFLVFRMLSGVGASCWTSFIMMCNAFYDKNETPKVTGLMNACNYCGRFIAYILGGIVAQAISNLAPFLLTFGVGLLGFIISLFIKDIHVVKEPLKTADLLKVAGDKRLWAFALLATVIQYISFSTYYAFSNDMAKALGASDFSLGTMSAVLTVPLMFGSFFSGGKILKKCGAKAVVVATVGCMTAYCFILPFVPNMFWFYVMQVVGGIGYGFCLSIVMGLGIQHIASEKRSTAMGLFQSIYSIGMTIGPMITGVFKQQFNMTVAFLSVGVIGVLGCIWTLVIVPGRASANQK